MNNPYAAPRGRKQELTTGQLIFRLARILFYFLYLSCSVLYMELILRGSIQFATPQTPARAFYLFGFSFSFGLLITAVALCFGRRGNRIVHIAALSLITLVFCVQYGYFHFFGSFFRWKTIGMAADVTDFYKEAFQMIRGNWFSFILLLMPLLLYLISMHHYAPKRRASWVTRGILAGAALLLFVIPLIVVRGHTGDFSDSHFFDYLTPEESVNRFGLMTATRQEFAELLFGAKTEEIDPDKLHGTVDNPFDHPDDTKPVTQPSTGTSSVSDTTAPVTPPAPIEYGYNMIDIDWDALIAGESDKTIKGMHQYFSNLSPTQQNEYTALFKGKNLIMLTLEGFSGRVLELAPELFPLMNKMANEGFVFENYYCSCWGGSTASGEYANMTGLFYKDAYCLKNSAVNYMPFTLGNQFNQLGYSSLAFHNWRAEYYSRNLSHIDYGYDYYAYDPNSVLPAANRLDFSSYVTGSKGYDWPMSDDVMGEITLPYFIDKTPFNVYYMTVSGHATYSWGGNAMSRKHKGDVQALGLPYSETVQAYIAANLEVELMLQRLCDALEAKGLLEDTVFVMACDHYPYGLTYNAATDEYDVSYTSYLSELYGLSETGIKNNPELYKNSLILWSASMKTPVKVSTPCSAIDILPTVSNLFGLKYDSRLMMGTDILSDTDPLVILNCDTGGSSWNWINRYGYYNTANGSFTPAEGVGVDSDKLSAYIAQINEIIKAKRKYSWLMLEQDYYRYLKSYLQ